MPAGKSIVVTGLGAYTPVGTSVPAMWDAFLAGRSGTRALTDEWASDLPVRVAARAAGDPGGAFPPARARRLDRAAQFALLAADEAWKDADLPAPSDGMERLGAVVDPEYLGVVIGTAVGGVTSLLDGHTALMERGARGVSPHMPTTMIPNSPAAHIGITYGAQASVHTTVSACASSTEALILAADMIRLGRADLVIAGGAEAPIHPVALAGFAAMRALSQRNDDPAHASRPYDKNRDGFVLGEGAGMLILEDEAHARARGARSYCRFAGTGISVDAHHIAQPQPEGLGASVALTRALRDAQLAPVDIGHINAHATATPLGDLAEARALHRTLAGAIDHIPVSATKSMTGHLQGAVGAVEAVATVLAVHHRTAPVTINIDDPDDQIQLDIVRHVPRPLGPGPLAALSNSFGFGGQNATVVFTSI
ncbi:beta-ketoacyl-[acyl-carrier-protein] synthase family protein [Streptomyces sp. JJ66]|uniref:beta-ketoacyl-[acyl-carrier-protein] synthase family protein n=1 Tax=Streptomyces sp. JJ66 TaxID=2803843 RepID=UPI0027E26EB8|nr:beta-ketoacyl-[acyl-carrier-protein] synthase family protein [Streptomyces sp. JJ66]